MPEHSSIFRDLTSFLDQHLPDRGSISFEAPFTDLGVDSFVLMELVLFAERHYGVTLPLSKVAACTSLLALEAIISELIAPIRPTR